MNDPNLIYVPDNIEIEDSDFVLRTYVKKFHCLDEKTINPEIFLLRRQPHEKSISVVIEKLLEDPVNPIDAIKIVPSPNNIRDDERGVFRIQAGDLRNLLIGVCHSPSNRIVSHGSLSGYLDIKKAKKIVGITTVVTSEITI